ncbi:MAG: ABC transporter ATP-binding protein [Clostridiales bacterium]|nr:ABC transporter ATP-binding protein [Candidatus Equinaster intestinalis]
MRPMGPPPGAMNDRFKAAPPKNFKDLPRFIKETVGGTASRLIYVYKLVWEIQPFLMIFLGFMTIYNGVMPIAGTFITANLIEKVVESFSKEVNLIIPLAFQFGYLFLNALTQNLNNILIQLAGEQMSNHVKVKIMTKAKSVDLASFDMPDFYERLENAMREAGMRPVNILRSSFELISKIISMISYFAVLIALLGILPKISILFFFVFIALNFISTGVSFHFRKKSFYYMFRRSKDRRQMNYYTDLMVDKDMVKEIRLFDLSDILIGKYKSIFSGYFKGIKGLLWKEGIWNIILSMLTVIMNGVLFFMIATNVEKIGDYSVYTGALNALYSGLVAIIATAATIYEGSLFIDNMILFMKEKQTVKPLTDNPLIPAKHTGHTIELKNVTFRYPGSDHDVIHGVNLKFEAGKTFALVGLNGAGKTTLIKLITRLYDPTEGQVLFDGKDIREYDLKELYSLYGIIFQDFGKYAETVSDNIAYSRASDPKDMERVKDSAVRASADEFISKLKHGYDTPLTRYFETDGKELSIGQWQKLSVARAFYADSDILILDEPTASLDAIAEQEIYNQFDSLRSGKTSIFVSHRLSSATIADTIVVLENGRVIEIGNHNELIKNENGTYHKLFTTQASRYMSKEAEND